MSRRKRSFLLSEIAVGLCLMALLFGSISFWQLLVTRKHERHKHICKIFNDESLAYKRLRAVFSAITGSFSMEGKSICSFIFDRGVYKKPALSGQVLGSLFYDEEQGVLKLLVRSQKDPEIVEECFLLDNLTAFECTPVYDSYSQSSSLNKDIPAFITFTMSRKATKYTASRELSFTIVSGR